MTAADLREQCVVELDSLDIVEATLRQADALFRERTPTPIERAGAFSLLLQLYGGFERVFKRIHKFYGFPLPAGEDSHQKLMNRFVENRSEREYPDLPALIPTSLLTPLSALRRFRHAAVHGYSHRFDDERVGIALSEAPALYATFKREVERFLQTLPQD